MEHKAAICSSHRSIFAAIDGDGDIGNGLVFGYYFPSQLQITTGRVPSLNATLACQEKTSNFNKQNTYMEEATERYASTDTTKI